ncbi:unnamed protein product [Fraxinus pennsylvanica]|uniref:Uncharacterized protein n=1 Tax=Fraxinus pennsylvanica TaxID=56036 RepID=A0AAD2A2E6_9LAMI|nr:unnamed protein product [Fraxinus pennsylvanica]
MKGSLPSAKFNTRLEQSTTGVDAECEADWTVVKRAMNNNTKKNGSSSVVLKSNGRVAVTYALAMTLSQGEAKVQLLERGGLSYENPNITSIGGFPQTLADTSTTLASQLFLSTDGVFNHAHVFWVVALLLTQVSTPG